MSRWVSSRSSRAAYFASGRHAIAQAVLQIQREFNLETIDVLVPELICEAATSGLHPPATRVHFYRVSDELVPDWNHADDLVRHLARPVVMLLAHYFGRNPSIEEVTRFKSIHHDVRIVHDAAHSLCPEWDLASGDFLTVSPHKVLPIPPVGILFGSTVIENSTPGGRGWYWLLIKSTQRLMISAGVPWHKRWTPPAGEAERFETVVTSSEPALAQFDRRVERYKARRKRNALQLRQELAPLEGVLAPWFATDMSDAPYALATKTTALAADVASRLWRVGVPAFQWPGLPSGATAHATQQANHCLLLPVHQDLDEARVSDMAQRIGRVLRAA